MSNGFHVGIQTCYGTMNFNPFVWTEQRISLNNMPQRHQAAAALALAVALALRLGFGAGSPSSGASLRRLRDFFKAGLGSSDV